MAGKNDLSGDIARILESIEGATGQDNQAPEEKTAQPATNTPEDEDIQTLHIYPVDGGILILRDEPAPDTTTVAGQVVDETPIAKPTRLDTIEKNAFPIFLLILCVFLCLDSLNSFLTTLLLPTVTVTIVPKTATIQTTAIVPISPTPDAGSIQGRLLPVLTITQSKTVNTSGKGHQNAQVAQGAITFYNGRLTSQTIAGGTIFTGSDGVQVEITQDAVIPAGSPPNYGVTTVAARAINTGSQGNIAAKDIDTSCCSADVLAINLTPFSGGQNERDYSFVTKNDLQSTTAVLTNDVSQAAQKAIAGELTTNETLIQPSCSTSVNSNHKTGDEAQTVTVSFSEHCVAGVYNTTSLQDRIESTLSTTARKQLGTHYSMFGNPQVTILQATLLTNQGNAIATLHIKIEGTWMYQYSPSELAHMKNLIAGKQKREAQQIISRLPGIQSIGITGINDSTSIPTALEKIHIVLIV